MEPSKVHTYKLEFEDGKSIVIVMDLSDGKTVKIEATRVPIGHEEEYLAWSRDIVEDMMSLMTPAQVFWTIKEGIKITERKSYEA